MNSALRPPVRGLVTVGSGRAFASRAGETQESSACIPRARGQKKPGVVSGVARDATRRVWFYRGYRTVSGGSIKHSHYFEHVLRMPGFAPRIAFRGEPANESHASTLRQLWPARDAATVAGWEPAAGDLLFLAGVDWRYWIECGLEDAAYPRINLIQSVRHSHEGTELYGYLSEPAVRICVSWEVAQAILATGRTRGPVLTIPNGIDLSPFEASERGSPAGFQTRRRPVLLAGYKRPDLARGLSERLDAQRIEHRLLTEFLDRDTFLGLLAESRVAVCLPHAEEGFYLPALEAMASGAAVVTLDCIGNRGFCHDHWNCVIAEPDSESLFRAVQSILAMSASEHGRMHRRARDTVARHSLGVERRRFHSVLRDIDRLWRAADILPAQGL